MTAAPAAAVRRGCLAPGDGRGAAMRRASGRARCRTAWPGSGRRHRSARSALVAEAGTGVGKTFAYLVPLLLSGRRALVSTATKSLQDQLFLRDLPRLRDALGRAGDSWRC